MKKSTTVYCMIPMFVCLIYKSSGHLWIVEIHVINFLPCALQYFPDCLQSAYIIIKNNFY